MVIKVHNLIEFGEKVRNNDDLRLFQNCDSPKATRYSPASDSKSTKRKKKLMERPGIEPATCDPKPDALPIELTDRFTFKLGIHNALWINVLTIVCL